MEQEALDAHLTVRGDRDGRRRDVLAAASEILKESGWDGLSIRAVASRAGVSTGAVYQWFSGKDEIYGELFDREIRAGIDLIDTIPTDISLTATVRLMVDWVVDLYERLGRYQLEFIEGSSRPTRRDMGVAMIDTYLELGEQADRVLQQAAERDGLELVENAYRITWFWAGCVGTGERLIVFPQLFLDERREELLQFASDSLARSLVEPS